MIALEWETGTRTTTDVPLVDAEAGASITHAGEVVRLTVRWPDDPAVARERAMMLATLDAVQERLTVPGSEGARIARTDVAPDVVADLLVQRENALRQYAAALVASWTAPVECSRANVLDLFGRAPFALSLVLEAAGDADRFLPPSLRAVSSASEPTSLVAA